MRRLTRHLSLAVVSLFLAAAACSSGEDGGFGTDDRDTGGGSWTTCQRHSDCPSGHTCVAGLCQSAAEPPTCLYDSGCGYGQRCVDGRCVDREQACSGDDDCPGDMLCDAVTGACATACPDGCDDGDACTVDTCTREGCQHADGPPCCGDPTACDDGNDCTTDACGDGGCTHEPLDTPECCAVDADCEDGETATVDRCVEYTCRHLRPCTSPAECDDGDSCTEDRCVAGACANDWVRGCCHFAADCDDDNPCTAERCDNGGCRYDGVPGCCDDDAQCDDGDPCTQDTCGPGGTCTFGPAPCCTTDAECADTIACTADTCENGMCAHTWQPNCCTTAADCQDDDPCTTDSCGPGGLCTNPTIAGCCEEAADCEDDDPCTRDSCEDNACISVPEPACCQSELDCTDDDECTTDRCVDGQCVFTRIPECCNSDADCADGFPLTTDTCDPIGRLCRHVGPPCTVDSDCEDGVAATIDDCDPVGQTCRYEARVACAAAGECDDSDACTLDRCEAQTCVWELNLDPVCRCEADADCEPDEICGLLRFEDGGIWGYCSDAVGTLPMGARCAGPEASETCRSGLCIELLGVHVCYGGCRSNTDCAAGSTCEPTGLPSGTGQPDHTQNVCLPAATACDADTECPASQFCHAYPDPSNPGQVFQGCVEADPALGRTGEPCDTNSQCNSGFCLRDENQGDICFGLCDGDEDCRPGQRCYDAFVSVTLSMGTANPDDDRVVGLPACAWDFGSLTPCTRETDCAGREVCFPLLNTDETDFEPACVQPPAGTSVAPGGVCTQSTQCESGVCVGGVQSSRCLQFCVSDADCASPTTCETVDFTVARLDGSVANIPADVCVDD